MFSSFNRGAFRENMLVLLAKVPKKFAISRRIDEGSQDQAG